MRSADDRERMARRILAKQLRRVEEHRRFESLPIVEQRIRKALSHARSLLDAGVDPKLVELTLFDLLPEDAEPADVMRTARRVGPAHAHDGTLALVYAQGIGWERGKRAGADSAQRLSAERELFGRAFAEMLMRLAGVEDQDS